MFIPALIAIVPSLIGLAENVFKRGDEKTGSMKKAFVLDVIGKLYDNFDEQIPDWLSKKLCLTVADSLIESLVPQLTK